MTKFSLRLQLLTLCLFFFCCVFSQSLKLTGKVVNERKEAVSGASVQVNGASGVATNIDGIYMLSLIPGKYEITVSAVGYTSKTVTDIDIPNGLMNELNIVLQSATKDLGNVVITTNRSTARRESINSLIQFQRNTKYGGVGYIRRIYPAVS